MSHARHLLICCVYRPPSALSSWMDVFYCLANYVISESTSCVILGDVNIDLLVDPHAADDLYTTFGLVQHIQEPTRITASTATLLDHIYTSSLQNVSSKVIELHIADHRAMSCTIPYQGKVQSNLQNHRTITFRSMKGLNQEALHEDLSNIQWTETLAAAFDISDMASRFNDLFRSAWNRHAPLITRRTREKCTPWMTSRVLQLIHKRDSSNKCFLHNRTDELYRAYKILRNAVTNAARIAKRDFLICGGQAGTRQFWRHIKQCTGMGRVKQNLTP